jgi:putative transposase
MDVWSWRDRGTLLLTTAFPGCVRGGQVAVVVGLGFGRGHRSLVRELLVGLRERGLDVTGPILVVIDGAKALRRAVNEVFDHPAIQRCQLHKLRNVQDRLPQKLRSVVAKRMRAAYHAETALAAQAQLEILAGELERTHPGAAASLREGLTETLTVLRLDVPPTLARTLRSIN